MQRLLDYSINPVYYKNNLQREKFLFLEDLMEEKVAIIGIFVQDISAAARVNELLHEYADCIIGRIGIPYREKSLNIISVIICAPPDKISALSGKLGRIKGISAKAMQAKTD